MREGWSDVYALQAMLHAVDTNSSVGKAGPLIAQSKVVRVTYNKMACTNQGHAPDMFRMGSSGKRGKIAVGNKAVEELLEAISRQSQVVLDP